MQGETQLCFPEGHPAFAGHFPGHPIVPGVMLLDAAIHAISAARPGAAGLACQVSSAKFLSPVAPGEALTVSWAGTGKGQTRFEITGPGRQVATGVLAWDGMP